MGMTWVDWVSYLFVAALQVVLFLKGIAWIEKFLNFAGPAVYVVMVALLIAIWVQAGDRLLPAVGSIFNNSSVEGWAAVGAFFGVIGTMIAYFSAVIINFGDFARFSQDREVHAPRQLLRAPCQPHVLHVPEPVHDGRRLHRPAGRRG